MICWSQCLSGLPVEMRRAVSSVISLRTWAVVTELRYYGDASKLSEADNSELDKKYCLNEVRDKYILEGFNMGCVHSVMLESARQRRHRIICDLISGKRLFHWGFSNSLIHQIHPGRLTSPRCRSWPSDLWSVLRNNDLWVWPKKTCVHSVRRHAEALACVCFHRVRPKHVDMCLLIYERSKAESMVVVFASGFIYPLSLQPLCIDEIRS